MSPFKWGDDLFLKNSLLLFAFHFFMNKQPHRHTNYSPPYQIKNTSSCSTKITQLKQVALFILIQKFNCPMKFWILNFEILNLDDHLQTDGYLKKKTGKINYFPNESSLLSSLWEYFELKNFKHRQYFRWRLKEHEKHRRLSERHFDTITRTQSPGFESPVLPIFRWSLEVSLWNKIQK